MRKAYYLSSCDTCKRILKELSWEWELVDIKVHNIEAEVLDRLAKQYGSYEALFSKRAMKYKLIKDSIKTDLDYRSLILEEYTFLKRPVIFIDKQVFVGNSPKVIEAAKLAL